MENVQRELISVLLRQILSLGLLSKSTYLRAMDLVLSTNDFPELFRHPACLMEAVRINEYPPASK